MLWDHVKQPQPQEQEPPLVLLELAIFIYLWQTAQNSRVRQIICGAKLKFTLVVFFICKALCLCAVGDIKTRVMAHPGALPCPAWEAVALTFCLSCWLLQSLLVFYFLSPWFSTLLFIQRFPVSLRVRIIYLMGCMCACSLSSEVLSCPDLCHLLGKYFRVMYSLEINFGSFKIIVVNRENIASREKEHFSIDVSVMGAT